MASITKEKSGTYRLKFLDGNKTIGIRLGTRDKKAAISARAFVEALITAKKLGVSPDGETVAWLNRLDDVSRLHKGNGAQNMSRLRRIALNLIKRNKITRGKARKGGIKTRRGLAGWDNDFLLEVLTGIPAT